MEAILKFLQGLAKNNKREWMEQHRDQYLEAKSLFEDFVERLIHETVSFDDSVAGIDAKKCIFRINRDMRFSKEKKPYKINFGASISSGGKSIVDPGYYIHIEPANRNFSGGGLYMPEKDSLLKLRQKISADSDRFLKIVKSPSFKKRFSDLDQSQRLVSVPRGFSKEDPMAEYLKLKGFIGIENFSDNDAKDKGFLKKVALSFKAMADLNKFLRDAIR